MKITRKQFLQIAGASLVGAAAGGKIVHAGQLPVLVAPPATRWGMAVDFQKCRWDKDCDRCLAACKQAHNIPSIPDAAHEIKWIWKERYAKVFPQAQMLPASVTAHPLTILCNHCSSPACTRVCPTRATWKREDGVVMMDWHRCIGCRYCMAACPYGSRSFNWVNPRPYVAELNPDFPTRSIGVVEKCNLCEERLAKGEPPACVAGCPEKALLFGNLADAGSEIRRVLASRFAVQRRPELGTGPAVYYLA